MSKLLAVLVLAGSAVALSGCQSVPVTFAPFAGYGGQADGFKGAGSEYTNSWQVGVGASFTLGGQGGYVTPVPGHAPLPVAPARVNVTTGNVNNSNSNSNTNSNENHTHHNTPQ